MLSVTFIVSPFLTNSHLLSQEGRVNATTPAATADVIFFDLDALPRCTDGWFFNVFI